MKTNKLIILDLEATCWDDKDDLFVSKNQEIIEIGITFFDTKEKKLIKTDSYLVKPEGAISPFCTKLTSITEDMVKNMPNLEETFRKVQKDYNLRNYVWGSWGFYDLNQMRRESKRKNIKNPFLERNFINIKTHVAMTKGWPKGVKIEKALENLGLSFDGRAHRADVDTKNIAKVLANI